MVGHEEYIGETGNDGARRIHGRMGNGNKLVSDILNSGTVDRNGVNRRAINEVRYRNIFVVGCEWWIGLI
jgi:hypothetical protein